ncbi:hypothetical protein R50072_32100 [Simiduia litorea]
MREVDRLQEGREAFTTSYKLQATSYKLQATSYKAGAAPYKLQGGGPHPTRRCLVSYSSVYPSWRR